MFRAQIRIVLLLLIITTLVMGCAPQVAVPTGSEGTQAADTASGERPTIELLLNTGDQLPPDERNFIKQALDEALGIVQ